MSTTYRKNYPTPGIPADERSKGAELIGKNIPKDKAPKVFKDGTLEVENLVERNDKLSYDIDEKNNTYYFTKTLDGNTEVQYIPQFVDKVYKTTATWKGEVNSAFAVYRNEVKDLLTRTLQRYSSCSKAKKKEIDYIEDSKNTFIFTEYRGTSLWNKVYKESTDFGPYNYDVKLEVTEDIDIINDLIVIRSGQFANKYDRGNNGYCNLKSGWGIAWVSPHETLAYSGQNLYFSTGETYYDKMVNTGSILNQTSGAGTLGKNYGIVQSDGSGDALKYYSHGLSSKFIKIKKGSALGTGMTYLKYNDTSSVEVLQDTNPLYHDFYYVYDEFAKKYNKTGWNGIIPSGYWFSIETWSTNPKNIGFNGEITIKPTGNDDPTCTYSATCTGVSYDLNYQRTVNQALIFAKRKFYRNLNKILISKGIKNKPARLKKYDKLLERVAQNVYDGLSIVRNDQVNKVQGLEANPLDSPNYYDGTSKIYGGNKFNSLYNPRLLFEDRWIDGVHYSQVHAEPATKSSSSLSSSTSSSSY